MHPRSTIERYVADGLSAADERELRKHLRACADCRAHYDAQRLLLRALAGDANEPTAQELALHSHLASSAVFADASARSETSAARWFDRLLWTPARTWALGAGAAAAVLVLIIVLMPREGSEAMPLAAVVTHARAASLAGAPLSEAGEVRALDIIDVAKGGVLELTLERGGSLRVFPDSRIALGARGASVTLKHGKIWCLPEEGKGSFEVTTTTASVRVLGTSFIVDADEAKTDVRVVSGSVEVTDSDEQGRVRLQRDESTRVERGQRPASPRRASTSADTREWQRFFDELVKSLEDGVKSLQRQIASPKPRQGPPQNGANR